MIRLIRILGFLSILAGAVVLLIWAIKPLRFIWPWLEALPWPIKLAVALGAAGLLILFGSLLWERFEDRHEDRRLRDEE